MSDDAVAFVDPHSPAQASTVGSWRVLERVDSGSHGVVFRAQRAGHPDSPPVALKLARHATDPRFEREAQLLQRMQHLGVPRYEDSGLWTSPQGDRSPYVVMEWVEGLTLYDWFREQQRSSREVLRSLAQVARGLEAVHAQGAFHRDVKGDNIRVTPEGRAVLVDFGACWLPGARPLTDTLAPPGTTPYRAPELLRFMWRFRMDSEARWHSRPSDDLYALGVTAYRLVTGTYPPPITEDEDEVPRKLLRPRELTTVTLELQSILLRLLSEECEARGTATEIAKALERAEQRAGPDADKPILPTPAAAPTEKGAPRFRSGPKNSIRPRPRPSPVPRRRSAPAAFPAWLASASAAVVGGLLAVAITELLHPAPGTREAGSATDDWHTPLADTPDAGVGEESLLSVAQSPQHVSPAYVVGLPMPKAPLPGQKKPPCDEAEVAALGACWIVLEKKPPCGGVGYEHGGKCVRATFEAPHAPTSGEP